MPEQTDIVISRLGSKGDGCADEAGQQVFVPYGLPGETWRRNGDEWLRLSDSSARVTPPCRHFELCGGCIAQHMSPELYGDWKLGIVQQAFAHQGIEAEPGIAEAFPLASRRRCALTANKSRSGLQMGFLAARSHNVVDMTECSVLASSISGKLDDLRGIVDLCAQPGGSLRIDVLASDTGLDVNIDGDTLALGQELRTILARRAAEAGLARLIVGGHEVAQLHVPIVNCSGVDIAIHPQAFLQAVAAAEAELVSLVLQSIGRAKIACDLFCGIGTFSFALARRTKVVAIDSDRPSIETLCAARDRAQKLKPIDARVRDLFHEPLSRKELEGFDAVVFDPPRAGAEGQARMLAKSAVPKVVAVSCNPATLARDVRHLLDGGYQLDALHCVDQFQFSPHVECVAALSKPGPRRRR